MSNACLIWSKTLKTLLTCTILASNSLCSKDQQTNTTQEVLSYYRPTVYQKQKLLDDVQPASNPCLDGGDLVLILTLVAGLLIAVDQLLEGHSTQSSFLTSLTHLSREIKKYCLAWSTNQHSASAKETSLNQLIADYPDPCLEAISKDKGKKIDEPDELLLEPRWIRDGPWVKRSSLWVCTVAQYPENRNPVLPLTLQQELDQKTPREYLSYIREDLTTEERESLMVDEGQRRKTFLTQWPHDGTLSGNKMAEAGFYYLGERDQVQCVFCRGRLRNWSQQEVPMTEHARLFNFCRFVKGLECGNREYRSKKIVGEDMNNITVFGNLTAAEQRRQKESGADIGPLGICTNRAAVIKYAPDAARLRTLQRWPASIPLTAEQVCEAGFYYTGFDDQVRCFYCAGGIKGWTARDEPWEEHARWFPDCSYLLNKKGKAYVDLIHQRTPDNKKCTKQTKMQKRAELKKKAVISEREAMPEICEKLGHDSHTIARALTINGKPFDSVKLLVDAVHVLEDSGEAMSQCETTPTPDTNVRLQQEHNPPAQQNTDNQAEQFVRSERQTRHKAGCRVCELKTTNFVPATNVGLPCGHLIYCDSCKTDESRKDQIEQVKCPYPECDSPLSGTIRVFFG